MDCPLTKGRLRGDKTVLAIEETPEEKEHQIIKALDEDRKQGSLTKLLQAEKLIGISIGQTLKLSRLRKDWNLWIIRFTQSTTRWRKRSRGKTLVLSLRRMMLLCST